jgi:tetratricopeptide (TPR) repeat protein
MEKRTCKVCDAREQLAREGQEYQSIIEQCGHDGTMRFLWYAPVPKNGREADRLIRAFLKAFGIKQAANGGYIHRLKDRDYQPDYSIQRKPEPPPVASLERRDAAYHKAGQHDLAIADYAKAILLDPYMGDWYYERGKIHQELGRYDAAVADYTKALKLNLDDNEAYYSRALDIDILGTYGGSALEPVSET